jgi:hypothetical protein
MQKALEDGLKTSTSKAADTSCTVRVHAMPAPVLDRSLISSHIQLIYCLRSLRFCGHVLCRILLQILDLFVIFVLLNNLHRTTIYILVIDTTGTFR